MVDFAQLALQPEDYERYDLDSLLCNHCTLGCNVIRVVPYNGEKLVLCGKRRETQDMLNKKRERLGIPAPGSKW